MLTLLQYIPVWVFVLFFLLLNRGLRARQDRVLPIRQALLLPAVMSLWSLLGVLSGRAGSVTAMAVWLLAAAFAVLCYTALNRYRPKPALTEQGEILVRGSWLPLCLMMLTFWTHFVAGTLQATQPTLLEAPVLKLGFAGIYGFVSGMFGARLFVLLGVWLAKPRLGRNGIQT